jgi:DNA topoisomerase-1
MSKSLIIVESAKKAKTLKDMLGRGFTIRATGGHILEMPADALHVDLKTFEPKLELIRGKGKRLQELKTAAAAAEAIYLATDPDREGEAIAQHVVERLGRNLARRAQRIAFTAITERDIRAALAAPRSIDRNLVEAQIARRVIDRLVGYMVSPVLWAGLSGLKRLSAGRVQSPALWLVVQRERTIRDFVAEEWWSIDAQLSKKGENPPQKFWARLIRIHGQKPSLKNAEAALKVKKTLEKADWRVATVKKGQRFRYPYPPFTTDSLQQAASSQLKIGPKTTMSLAQQLYEGLDVGDGKAVGLITYLRTDSVAVAPEAQQVAREVVTRYWGANYLPPKPPTYATRDKTAQEAHEAIRPTDPARTPKQVEPYLSAQQYQLYRLIWRRFIASQMRPAEYDTMTVDIETLLDTADGSPRGPSPYLFRATASTLRFAGFLRVYGIDEDAETARARTKEADDEAMPHNRSLPDLNQGEGLQLHQLLPKQHFTQPPPRYTEAGLIGELKKRGLGRPSTYATIIETLKQRQYVQSQQKRLHPTPLGFQVCELLEQHLEMVVDVDFTARMEADLDRIASGDASRLAVMEAFYEPFNTVVEKALTEAERNRQPAIRPTRRRGSSKSKIPGARAAGQIGRRGKGRKSRRTSSTSSLPSSERAGRPCPQCGQGKLVVRSGRYGPFIGCSRYREGCKYTEKLVDNNTPTGTN